LLAVESPATVLVAKNTDKKRNWREAQNLEAREGAGR